MKGYRLSKDAFADLREIRNYLIDEAGTEVADSVLRSLQASLAIASRNPFAGYRRSDLTDAPVRFWGSSSYVIVYVPGRRPIQIVRILHGSRDLAALLGPRR